MQSYASHRRYYPIYHFVAVPVLLLYFIASLVWLVQRPGWDTAADALVCFGLVAALVAARGMALRAQDRVIRLEERLRTQALAPGQLAQFDALRPRLVVALRFAGDAEFPELLRRAAANEFATPDDLKRAIREWRPDYLRV